MRRKIFIVLVVFIAICNMAFSLYSNNEIAELTALKMEAFANDETGGGSGIRGPLNSYGCTVIINEIVGHNSDGSVIVQPTPYAGELGRCMNISGTCTPYDCTKLRH